MSRRLIEVTAGTTFEHVQTQVVGEDWLDEGVGVLDATVPDHDPDRVELCLELAPGDQRTVDQHADIVVLSPGEARELARALEVTAEEAER